MLQIVYHHTFVVRSNGAGLKSFILFNSLSESQSLSSSASLPAPLSVPTSEPDRSSLCAGDELLSLIVFMLRSIGPCWMGDSAGAGGSISSGVGDL